MIDYSPALFSTRTFLFSFLVDCQDESAFLARDEYICAISKPHPAGGHHRQCVGDIDTVAGSRDGFIAGAFQASLQRWL